MLTKEEFDNWCNRNNLSALQKKTIEIIRSSEPARRVGGGRKNVSGFYPSQKMGRSIQFESHKLELALIYQLEHDWNILEFYDQPPSIKLQYQSQSGRNICFLYTPDFFVLRRTTAGWIECKTSRELKKKIEKQPQHYNCGEDGQWQMPLATEYAAQLGMDFCVWSDAQINWVLQRNIIFLEDYYRSEYPTGETATTQLLHSILSSQPGIALNQLLHQNWGIKPDEIYSLIATEQIYVDLSAAPLVEPQNCKVFPDLTTAQTYQSLKSSSSMDAISLPVVDIAPSTPICWDGIRYTILQSGETEITLLHHSGELIELRHAEFNRLLQLGKITALTTTNSNTFSEELRDLLKKASPADLEQANQRYHLLQSHLSGQPTENQTIPERTLRSWQAKYRIAQQKYGYGYIGLLTTSHTKGNRNRKLPQQILELMTEFITQDYETHKQKRKSEVYGAFARACSTAGIPDNQIPSYKTFIQELKRHSGYNQTLKRQGQRAAYPQQPFYWELELTTPRHGDRPFEIGHIDHTQLDIEVRCSKTGVVLGRPWATFLVDAESRRILAVYITFDPPSYRSCMMVLRICVMRHSRLPQIIITDNGKEFHSTYFESLLAWFECTLKHRPPIASRFSGVCERLFGTANTQFLYNLTGNTQITKNVRLVTKSVNPKNLAVWTLGSLYLYLCEWAYSEYDTTPHPALGVSPRSAFTTGLAKYGNRSHRQICNDENWKLLTLPSTPKGQVKVHPTQGIQIRGIRYWSNAFKDPEIHHTYVNIRYDPFDAGVAYAYVRGQWVKCISEYYSILKGRSEKEIWLATAELQKRQQNHQKQFLVRAKKLAEFLGSAESEEALLSQRLMDAQMTEVFQVIEGRIVSAQIDSQLPELKPIYPATQDSSSSCQPSAANLSINPNELPLFDSY
jgi:transposase InsO family protein